MKEVPELAGCMADGKTYQKALTNTETVINEWIKTATELGLNIPQPVGRAQGRILIINCWQYRKIILLLFDAQ